MANTKKKRSKLAMAIISGALAIGMIFGMAACTPKDPTPKPTPTPTPEIVQQVEGDINLDANGILTWNAAKNATGYKIRVNDETMWDNAKGEAIIYIETEADVSEKLRDGTNEIGISSVGKNAEGETINTAYKEYSVEFNKQQEAQKPGQVTDINFAEGVLSWNAPAGSDLKFQVTIDGQKLNPQAETYLILTGDFVAEGAHSVSIVTIDKDGNLSEEATSSYSIQKQQEQNYKEQIDANLNTKINSFLSSRLYKNIQNVEVKKVDIRDNADTAKSEMLLWFNADVSKGVNNWNRDFIYKIQLGKQYDLTNNETNQKAIADATDELASIPNTAFEEILNNESINENVVETLFGLQNCDSTLKALQGKKIEMETITSVSGGDLVINAIVDNKLVAISIRNTKYQAGWTVAQHVAAIKAGGEHISTSTTVKEKFSENSNVYDTMKAVIREAKAEQARMIADILFIKHVLSKDTGMSF